MPRRRYAFDEPIDFAALAIARSRKGWRPTPTQKAAWAKKRAAKRKRERAAAGKRFQERRRAERVANPLQRTHGAGERFLAAFQPGCWYGVGDIAAASGVNYSSCKAYVVKFRKLGLVERTKNPAFERWGFREPEWLYRLVKQKGDIPK
jgi:hypothetical protein